VIGGGLCLGQKGLGLFHFDLVRLLKKSLIGFSPRRGVFPG